MTGYELISLCIKFDLGEAKAVAKSTLVALASFYNEERDGSWPGEKDLLPRAACERRALFRAIQWLEEIGLVTVERSAGKGNFYRFNVALLEQGSYQKATSGNNGTSYQKVTSYQNVTAVVTKKQLEQLPKGNDTSYQKVTAYKKEKIKKEKEDFSLMTDSELVDFFSAVPHEEGIEARAEYTRRVLARNKQSMRPDFEQPDRPHYEILGMR